MVHKHLSTDYSCGKGARVLARISKVPVQNSNSKISARPYLATYPLHNLPPTTLNSLSCQKGHFAHQLCPRRWFLRKIFGNYPPKVKIENFSWKILPVQKGGFQETTCPKDRQDGSSLKVPEGRYIKNQF